MTLTPREYLHQHFGSKDRRWIESLTEERCWELTDQLTQIAGNLPYGCTLYIKRPFEDLHPLPEVPGEYENWR